MSDLLSPIYVVFDGNEADSFWGLVGLMKIMVSVVARQFSTKLISGVQFLARPERNEATAVDVAAAHWCHGP